jgi:hypothetical protein
MVASRYPGYKCPVKGCGAKFVRPNGFRTGLAFHTRTVHANGALYAKGGLTVWDEGGDDGKYLVICERHHQCTNSDNLAWCKSLKVTDFCEVCAGTAGWCVECEQDCDLRGAYGGGGKCYAGLHWIINDSVQTREYNKIAEELYGH